MSQSPAAMAARLALGNSTPVDNLSENEKQSKNAVNGAYRAATNKDANNDTNKAAEKLPGGDRKTLPFMRILRYGTKYGFSLPQSESYVPTPEEIVAHLKILRAFAVLKKSITSNVLNLDRRDKLWQSYLTMATRRFVVFMDAVVRYNQQESPDRATFKAKLSQFLPPLDIIMVWHSFLLNTKSFANHIARHKLLHFLYFGFPIHEIEQQISNHTFIYRPSEPYWMGFNNFILQYSGHSEQFRYDSYAVFDPSAVDLEVCCPNCGEPLIHVPLLNDNFLNGFCDSNFEFKLTSNCSCGFLDTISHDELRKRLLWHDIETENLPNYFSPVYISKQMEKEDAKPEEVVKLIQSHKTILIQRPLLEFLHIIKPQIPSKSFLVLRKYLTINCIGASVPGTKFVLNEDLVACVFRQERFISRMEEINWLESLDLNSTVLESIERYENFVSLFSGNVNYPIVPTLDIDLAWHTHQLNPGVYFKYCFHRTSKIIHHDDKVEENRIGRGFEVTCDVYKTRFKKDYSICFCSYCSRQRTSQRGLFKKKKPVETSTVKSNVLNLGHISCHDSVHIPTERVKKIDTRLKHFYLKAYNNYLPWQEREVNGYITSPLHPIKEDDNVNLSLHANGMCYGVNDPESACTGHSGNGCFGRPIPWVNPQSNVSLCGGSSG